MENAINGATLPDGMVGRALEAAHDLRMAGLMDTGRPVPDPPYVIALFNLDDVGHLELDDFTDLTLVCDMMADGLLATWGEGESALLGGPRFDGIRPLQAAYVLMAEAHATGISPLQLIHERRKWAGATCSFGATTFQVSTGSHGLWQLGLAAYYADPVDAQVIVTLAAANLTNALLDSHLVSTHPVLSRTYRLDVGLGSHSYQPMT